ncbi:Acetone carboxylase gamma subunit [subsurface metagenome]
MVTYDKKTLERMIDGKLSWDELKPIISGRKDSNRFDLILEILQDRVSWKEKIILPLHEHLHIVAKDGQRIVKCDCGYEFGDYKNNWKIKSRVRVRDTFKDIEELYPKDMGSDPEWIELREYFCP